MIKLIVFDWDDVFTRGSIAGYYACYHEALKAVGVQLPPHEEDRRIKAKWGAGGYRQLEYLLQETPELVDEAFAVYTKHAHGQTFVNKLRIVPGSQQLLARLAKKYTLAVATGAHPQVLREQVMPAFAIPDVFAEVITIYDLDDMAHAKPHPYMVEQIMKHQQIPSDQTILVGDAPSDMQMARSANVEPIAVLTGHLNRQQAQDLDIKYIIKDVTHLEEILDQLNATG